MTHRMRLLMRWIDSTIIGVLMVSILGGCATSKDELMPTNGLTMQQLWNQGSSSATGAPSSVSGVTAGRQSLRRPIDDSEMIDEQSQHSRDATNEIRSQYVRLPNPDLVMFIYPHMSGKDYSLPVPGYSTVFPLYAQPKYAMPGESARPKGKSR